MTPRPLEPHEIPPGTPDRLYTMMTAGQAVPVKTDVAKVVAVWNKAVKSLRSSSVREVDRDTAREPGAHPRKTTTVTCAGVMRGQG